ncbi:hypothetical protein J4402_04925 [Candidatus Pacearchaeota archaeon]|nr:hypothetical protein [Candidatus Pacearchaeota archaeon]
MDITEKRTLFIEFLGKAEKNEEDYNLNVRGERFSFRLIGFRNIGENGDWGKGFPKDCTAYRLKYMVEILNNGKLTFRAYTNDLTGVILRTRD